MLTQAEILLSNVNSLAADVSSFTGDQTDVPFYTSQISSLTSEIEDLIANGMNMDPATLSAQLAAMETQFDSILASWIAYKAQTTTTDSTTTSKLDFFLN